MSAFTDAMLAAADSIDNVVSTTEKAQAIQDIHSQIALLQAQIAPLHKQISDLHIQLKLLRGGEEYHHAQAVATILRAVAAGTTKFLARIDIR